MTLSTESGIAMSETLPMGDEQKKRIFVDWRREWAEERKQKWHDFWQKRSHHHHIDTDTIEEKQMKKENKTNAVCDWFRSSLNNRRKQEPNETGNFDPDIAVNPEIKSTDSSMIASEKTSDQTTAEHARSSDVVDDQQRWTCFGASWRREIATNRHVKPWIGWDFKRDQF